MARRLLAGQGIEPRDLGALSFGGTQDAMVQAVLAGRVDAGTVRTDIIERMARAGLIDPDRLRVIHPRQVPDFPFRLSTRLYPEWPLASLPHADDELTRALAVALLEMPPEGPAAVQGRSRGWTVPGNYQPVHALMAKLRLGPYERPGPFGLRDILRKYGHWVALGLLGVLVLAGVSLLLAGLNRRLKASRAALNEARNRLEERVAERTAELAASEHKYRGIINGAREGFWLVAPDLTILEANQALGRILGYTPEEIAGRTPIDFVAPDPRRILEVELGRIAESETRSYEVTLLAKSGSRVPVLVQATTLWDQAGSVRFAGGVLTDLTAFKEVEASLRRNNRVLRALSRSNRALLYAEDEQELLDEVCRIAVEEGGYPLAWIGFCERDRHDLRGGVAMAGERPNAMAQLGSECQDDMAERYPSLQAIAMGRPVILQDLGHHTEAHPPGPGRPPITDWPLWPRCPSATKASRGPW